MTRNLHKRSLNPDEARYAAYLRNKDSERALRYCPKCAFTTRSETKYRKHWKDKHD